MNSNAQTIIQQLQTYISSQIQIGVTPDELVAQLRTANWDEESIRQAFVAHQAAQLRTGMVQQTQVENVSQQLTSSEASAGILPQAAGRRRGRIRTGWLLFRQSMRILNGNRYLLRYMAMTAVYVFGAFLVSLV